MSDIIKRVEKELESLKAKDKDLFFVKDFFVSFENIPHKLIEFDSNFDLSGIYDSSSRVFNERSFYETITLKLLLITDLFSSNELELRIVFKGRSYMNVNRDIKTNNFEGESCGYRIKDWQIVSYNLELKDESF